MLFPPVVSTTDNDHGRLEQRSIAVSTEGIDYFDFPYIGQIYRITRTRELKGKQSTTVEYGLTSLSPERATPAQLLSFRRQHWFIENKLHYVLDMTFDEDRSRVRTGNSPAVFNRIRALAINIFRRFGQSNMCAARQAFAACCASFYGVALGAGVG